MWVVRYHVWHVRFANRRIPRTCGQCIFLPGVYEKVATVRYVRNVGDIASRSNPHFYAHRDGHDGAYLVVGSHRLLASNASLFTEQPFGAVVSTFDEYLGVAQRRGNGCQPDQRAALRKYVCCDLPELEERFDALAPVAEFGTWSPRATKLWPRVGLGTLARVDVNLKVLKLDTSKTYLVFHGTGVVGHQLLAYLRFHLFAWSVADACERHFLSPFAERTAGAVPDAGRSTQYPILSYTRIVELDEEGGEGDEEGDAEDDDGGLGSAFGATASRGVVRRSVAKKRLRSVASRRSYKTELLALKREIDDVLDDDGGPECKLQKIHALIHS